MRSIWRSFLSFLVGSRVRLEPLTLDHLPGLCTVGLDERLWRLTVSQIRTPEDMRAYVDQALSEKARGLALPFATVDQKTGCRHRQHPLRQH